MKKTFVMIILSMFICGCNSGATNEKVQMPPAKPSMNADKTKAKNARNSQARMNTKGERSK